MAIVGVHLGDRVHQIVLVSSTPENNANTREQEDKNKVEIINPL